METWLIKIDWISVAIATLAYCAFSGFWHRQFMFGKKWEEAMGFQRPDYWKETSIYFIVPFFSCFVTTLVVAVLVSLINPHSIREAILLGLMLGVGFATAVTFTNAVLPIMKKPLIFGLITGTAHAIGITLATAIIYYLL